MKKLIFIHGPNGVGKTTLCRTLNKRLWNSAWVESEWCKMTNPFNYSDETIELTIKNMTDMLTNYINCSSLDYIIFNYGLHGPRRAIFEKVMENIKGLEFKFIPIIITCSKDENINRMVTDGRDSERIKRAIEVRLIYDSLKSPKIDTTYLSVEETVDKVIEIVNNSVLAINWVK